jgi:RNA polymerase sigma-70 factor (ECF subfamily)
MWSSCLLNLTDEDLVRELRRGVDEALAVLFDRHHRQIFHVARRVLRDNGEAEDLIQEIYLQFYRDAAKFDASRGSVKTWMLHNTYNRSLNRLKYLKIRGHYDEPAPGRPQPCSHPRSAADYRQSIRRGLDQLSKNERYAIEGVCFEGLRLRELAERRGQPLANIRNHYYRGIRKLRTMLAGERPVELTVGVGSGTS